MPTDESKDIKHLEELIDLRWKGHEQEHLLLKEMVGDARKTMDLRLEGMNRFREELEKNNTFFLRTETYTRGLESIVQRLDSNEKRIGLLEQANSAANASFSVGQRDISKLVLYVGMGLSFLFSMVGLVVTVISLVRK